VRGQTRADTPRALYRVEGGMARARLLTCTEFSGDGVRPRRGRNELGRTDPRAPSVSVHKRERPARTTEEPGPHVGACARECRVADSLDPHASSCGERGSECVTDQAVPPVCARAWMVVHWC
jgi:hypothetical protein